MTICKECGENIKEFGLKIHYQKEHPKEYESIKRRFLEQEGLD